MPQKTAILRRVSFKIKDVRRDSGLQTLRDSSIGIKRKLTCTKNLVSGEVPQFAIIGVPVVKEYTDQSEMCRKVPGGGGIQKAFKVDEASDASQKDWCCDRSPP